MDNIAAQSDAVPRSGLRPGIPADDDSWSQLGIRRVVIEEFHYGGYRYSNLKDALAEAQRHPGLGRE